jgi:DNA-binding HxlR family transcriptional regulator
MAGKKLENMNCSLARALSEVGGRWSLLIIREAFMGSIRFDEFHVRLGIARNILQARLEALVESGVLSRQISLENARIPNYQLTRKGSDLLPVVASLMHWGDAWINTEKGAPVLLVDRNAGEAIPRVTIRTRSGKPIKSNDIELHAGPGADARTKRRFKVPLTPLLALYESE